MRDARGMEEVAGYRVLRTAAQGAGSTLLLGFDDGETVVLKLRRSGDPRVRAELQALDRGAGEHVVGVLDVASDEHGTTLVLERLTGGSLADLLDRRDALAAGEAVTLLAPIAATLERLHSLGVAHGSLSPSSVVLRGDGAPVLVGFGAAELFAVGAPEVVREAVPGVVADRAALRGLAALVLERVTGDGAGASRRLAQRLRGSATGGGGLTPHELADALYALAVPAAIDPADAWDPGGEAAVAEHDSGASPDGRSEPLVLPPWLIVLLPEGIRHLLGETVEMLHSRWVSWPPGRRRLALGGAAGVLTLAVALAVAPTPSRDAHPAPAVTSAGPDTLETAADPIPDDPVAAVVELLARRDECLRELSVLCLDGVAQAGTAAYAADVAAVRSVLAGGELPSWRVEPGEPALVERLGDSALVDLPPASEPASVLVLRTAEGWRFRQYLTREDAEPPALEPGPG